MKWLVAKATVTLRSYFDCSEKMSKTKPSRVERTSFS